MSTLAVLAILELLIRKILSKLMIRRRQKKYACISKQEINSRPCLLTKCWILLKSSKGLRSIFNNVTVWHVSIVYCYMCCIVASTFTFLLGNKVIYPKYSKHWLVTIYCGTHNICSIFCEKRWLHKFILKLTDREGIFLQIKLVQII